MEGAVPLHFANAEARVQMLGLSAPRPDDVVIAKRNRGRDRAEKRADHETKLGETVFAQEHFGGWRGIECDGAEGGWNFGKSLAMRSS